LWLAVAEVRRLAAVTGLRGLVSFSDPIRRTTFAGQVVMPGHVGVIYRASNARYTGRVAAYVAVGNMRQALEAACKAADRVRLQSACNGS
jgi:hypothetical protein